jgi:hypothetical protein
VAVVTVEAVHGRPAFKRFVEFPYAQFRAEPRWSRPAVASERARLDPHNPFFDRGDGEYFLARRAGVVAGRITAHVARSGDEHGWFGFFDVIDDDGVAAALVDHAVEWLRGQGCASVTGPASFTEADDPGILVAGFDVPGTTGRPWHPPWYAAHLESAGLARTDVHRTWRLTPHELGTLVDTMTSTRVPSSKGLGDPRLVLDGIVAVPDLTPARGSAWTLARRARARDWEGCTIVSIDGDPSVLVPRLCAAAAAAGYQWVVSPWSPDRDAPPETVHARFSREL